MFLLTTNGPINISKIPSNTDWGDNTDGFVFVYGRTLYVSPFQAGIAGKKFNIATGIVDYGSKLNPQVSYEFIGETSNLTLNFSLSTVTSTDNIVKYLTINSAKDVVTTRGTFTFHLDKNFWDSIFLCGKFGNTKEIDGRKFIEVTELRPCHRFSQLFKITATNPNTGGVYVRYCLTFSFDSDAQSSIKSQVTGWGFSNVTVDYVITSGTGFYQYYGENILSESIYLEVADYDAIEFIVSPTSSKAYIGDTVKYSISQKYKGNLYPATQSVLYSASDGISVSFSHNSTENNCSALIGTDANKNSYITFKDTTTGKSISVSINVIDGADTQTGNSNPYLPEGGGISGGGSQSGSSNVIGSFDGTPGPSIDGNLQVGASGSDIASSGMYTKYLCNNGQLNVLAQLFWEDNIGIQAVKAIFGDPINSIISLVSYPFALDNLVSTESTTFYLGKYNSLLAATAITESSFQINWGEIEIPFFWGSFLDYAPYTKIQLYLPWGTGFVSIDPNEVMPFSANNSYTQGSFAKGKISVRTNIELDKGACVHSVIGNNGRIIGSFGGVVGKQIPMTGVDTSGKVFALFGAAVSVGTTAALAAGGYPSIGKGLANGSGMSTMNRATGREMLGEYKSAVSSALASSAALAKAPISYPRAGTFSDATNTLGYQYPYLIISRPSQSVPQQYGRFMGYPSNIFHNYLGEVSGYTEVSSIHLDNIPATSSELEELESILKGGVIL